MLFNSYSFIFLFVPITLVGFFLVGARSHHRLAMAWLVAMSLVFYAWWNPNYLGLLVFSILGNYAFGLMLVERRSKALLAVGIAANLGLLGFFKYTNFFLENMGALFGADIQVPSIILPLAISFFTFQQITYLVGAYQGRTHEYGFMRYCLFVAFFPQLIAGPIVHHKEMLPQFARAAIYKFNPTHLAVGLTIFFIGLFKKVVIADGIAPFANPVFDAAVSGQVIGFIEGWGAALAYTFQLYFDFSGYSDMAVGLARMFGIRLPINFFSPYKADSIIEFWRRWHMTLSRFLRDYVYIPIGGNRRRVASIMITMLLGGLWHGAGWTFIAWGGLHGLYLIINHVWRKLAPGEASALSRWIGRIITFVAVVIGWVLFRAESWDGALAILGGMFGVHGFAPTGHFPGVEWGNAYGILAGLLIVVWAMPNTYQLTSRYRPTLKDERVPEIAIWSKIDFKWRPSPIAAYVTAGTAVFTLLMLTQVSEFLYYRF